MLPEVRSRIAGYTPTFTSREYSPLFEVCAEYSDYQGLLTIWLRYPYFEMKVQDLHNT